MSLGVCGERECMDIRLTEELPLDQIAFRLNAHLPAGLRALEAAEPVDKFEDIQFGDYQLFLESQVPGALEEKLRNLLDEKLFWYGNTQRRAIKMWTSSRIFRASR